MFREMRRIKQQLSDRECRDVLKSCVRGVLSVNGEGGYPYALPINYWYNEENGRLYFHGSREGHKLDALKKDSRVSFCVFDEGFRNEGEWWLNINSVIIFGRIRFVDDLEEKREISRQLCLRFTDDTDYFEKEFESLGERVLCLELTPEHITGKRVKEK